MGFLTLSECNFSYFFYLKFDLKLLPFAIGFKFSSSHQLLYTPPMNYIISYHLHFRQHTKYYLEIHFQSNLKNLNNKFYFEKFVKFSTDFQELLCMIPCHPVFPFRKGFFTFMCWLRVFECVLAAHG